MELTHIAQRAGRLSSFLRQEMGLSSSLYNKLKWQQKLLVNGRPQHADFSVSVGDVICALLDDPAPQYPAQKGELTVLYEDKDLLAVEKPAGMLIHPSRSQLTDTLANFVLGYFQQTHQSCSFHPVTRLDRDTFGVVLLAKNAHIHSLLQKTPLEKTYEALTFGGPEQEEGEIDAPIARRELPSLLRYVNQNGKPSLTKYRVLERKGPFARLQLQPVTGRTHQLRVHCAYMGFPILGDPQYGTEASLSLSKSLGIQTQALCARRLQFVHPATGENVTILSGQML